MEVKSNSTRFLLLEVHIVTGHRRLTARVALAPSPSTMALSADTIGITAVATVLEPCGGDRMDFSNRMIGNVKRAKDGTNHPVNSKHRHLPG